MGEFCQNKSKQEIVLHIVSTFQLVTMLLTVTMETALMVGGEICIFAIFRHHDQVERK
jgi:hypothetical protein